MELFHDACNKLYRFHVAGGRFDSQALLLAVEFLDDSPVAVFWNGIGGEPCLEFTRNAVVCHPCRDLRLDVFERKNAADNRLIGLCVLLF